MFTIRTRARPSKPRRLSRRRRNPHPELPNKICLHRVLLRQVPLHKRIADGAVVAVADAADLAAMNRRSLKLSLPLPQKDQFR